MAFLDNSGDIILDAVLTDAGRQRMARGNFKIVKFALGDDEINYELFNSNHPSGSAFYDIEVMQTPILEALTNNTATMKSRLLTIARTNILYMPTLQINEVYNRGAKSKLTTAATAGAGNQGLFIVVATKTTEDALVTEGDFGGVLFGVTNTKNNNIIRIDQGQETAGDPPLTDPMDSDLIETQYIIQMDHRLGRIADISDTIQAESFVDDDNIATYYLGLNTSNIISSIRFDGDLDDVSGWKDINTPFNGPLGSRLGFKIKSSQQLKSSSALFTKLGGSATVTVTIDSGAGTASCYYIDSIVRVTGVTTGYAIDVPVRFIRKV